MMDLTLPGVPDTASHNSWADGGQLPLEIEQNVRMETMDRDGKVGMKVDSWWYVGEDGLPQDGTLGHQDILVSRL